MSTIDNAVCIFTLLVPIMPTINNATKIIMGCDDIVVVEARLDQQLVAFMLLLRVMPRQRRQRVFVRCHAAAARQIVECVHPYTDTLSTDTNVEDLVCGEMAVDFARSVLRAAATAPEEATDGN
mmetsp:Transcript_23446/g.54634  ORF Transcript_23446/g.54634 Transcript_23446/m.54634 type:complete len:124 (+) Transcript_23446:163-534(+)